MIDNAEDLLAAANAHGLRLDPASVELDASGVDFLVAHARDRDDVRWVLRAPRRPDASESAAYERRALELVRSRLPVAVPDWRVHTPELIAYPRIDGVPAAQMNVAAQRFDLSVDPMSSAFVDSFAKVLAALHAIDTAVAAAAGLRVATVASVRQKLATQMDATRRALEVPAKVWARWQAWLHDDTYWPAHAALVHGDLHPGHLLVDADHRVSGVLDWTEAEVADPATDFVLHYRVLGDAALSALLARYEAAGGRAWPRMKEHVIELAATYPILIVAFVERSGETAMLDFARALLNADDATPA